MVGANFRFAAVEVACALPVIVHDVIHEEPHVVRAGKLGGTASASPYGQALFLFLEEGQ